MSSISAESATDRERAFWDQHAPDLESGLRSYASGPGPNSEAMLDALEPLDGKRVLDFACGAGVTSAWLSDRGASVVGVDLSPESTRLAAELCRRTGSSAEFLTADLEQAEFAPGSFDRVLGRYALHHMDCSVVAPALARCLAPGGKAAFLETMDLNPVLRFSRSRLAGRLGTARYGTPDEHPLTREDLRTVGAAFGTLETRVRELMFLRIFDRNVLRYRRPLASKALAAVDDLLLERLGLGFLSYHQVIVCCRT